MRAVLVVALLVAFAGAALVATAPTAAACTPYSVCAFMHDLRCAQAQTDPVEAVECIDGM